MVALDLDVDARQPIQAHGIADRALHDVLQLDRGLFDEIEPPEHRDSREAGILGQRLARLGRERDRPRHAAVLRAPDPAGRQEPVVAPRRLGEDLVVVIRRAGATGLLARAGGPVEGRHPVGARARELGQARPGPLGALRIALSIGEPPEPPERRGPGLARRMLCGDGAVHNDRLGLTRQILEHASLQEECLRLLRPGAGSGDRIETGESSADVLVPTGAVAPPIGRAHVEARLLELERRAALSR